MSFRSKQMFNVNSNARHHQVGFTLIELVMVIVILGVLAATAIPRFVNLRSNANEATLKAMGGAILSSANMVYAKSVIQGVQGSKGPNSIDIDGDGLTDVEVIYGYPSANRDEGISNIMGGNFASAWAWSTTHKNKIFWLTESSFSLQKIAGSRVNRDKVQAGNCYLGYHPATSSAPPYIDYTTSGC